MKHIPDVLWSEIEKLIPHKTSMVGRPEFDNRKTLNGIFFVLKTGIQWKELPEKYGAPTTIHSKFMKWCRMGIFEKILKKAREYYRKRNSKNMWYAFDTTLKKAPFAKFGGKNPTDRSKIGVKHTLLVDRKGAPLFVGIAPANRHDSKLLKSSLKPMRKSKNVRIIAADSAFDAKELRSFCKEKNIVLLAATNSRRKINCHKYRPCCRWIVERTLGWFSWYRGLKICWAKTYISHLAFLQLAASIQLFKMGGIFG